MGAQWGRYWGTIGVLFRSHRSQIKKKIRVETAGGAMETPVRLRLAYSGLFGPILAYSGLKSSQNRGKIVG